MVDHDAAYEFLRHLEGALAAALPHGPAMEAAIRQVIAEATADPKRAHERKQEAAFLNHFVLPVVHAELQTFGGLAADAAREALLNEYHRGMREISKRSPASSGRHPFRKMLGASPESVYRAWTSEVDRFGLTQSCPDFALGTPFPHRIVFEGKYFARGSVSFAAKQLATDLYQAFFYRGLPHRPATKRHAAWDYDYACLLAFDASPEGTLKAAWDALPLKVRKSFWEGGNVYVMILRD